MYATDYIKCKERTVFNMLRISNFLNIKKYLNSLPNIVPCHFHKYLIIMQLK